jgi:hypothetical protein
MTQDYQLDPRFVAGVEMLGRTGAKDFRIGWSDEEDGEPIVWYAVATWNHARAKGADAAGALNPVRALMRLCEYVIDGGTCQHCDRSTIFDPNPSDTHWDALLDAMGCVYAWDPELKTFRRGCEGD